MKSLLAPLAALSIAATLVASSARPAPDKDEVRVTWHDKRYTPMTLPAELGAAPRTALEFWRPWAEEFGYQMAFDDDARVLLLVSRKRNPKQSLSLIAETSAVVALAAPLDAPRPAISERAPSPRGPGGPVELDPGAEPPATTWTWEDTGPALGTETAVVLELYGQEDYDAALARLAEHYDYLAPWVPSASRMSGFTLEQPLCAAFLKDGPGSEEFDPDNELVHRTARLLFLREYGRQPNWLASGLAWYVELDVRGTLYCFPYRDGFVGVSEHTGWDKELKRTYKKLDRASVDELARFERGTFEVEAAQRALGAATFLSVHHAERLPAILEELFETTRRDGRTHHGDGTWELIPDYELPAEKQDAIFAKHLGPRWTDELLESYRKGRAYKP